MIAAEGSVLMQDRVREILHGKAVDLEDLDLADVQQLVEELQIHQVELEMQNDELLRVQTELQAMRDNYADLYDLAPVGYLTLDTDGIIQKANLTAVALLGLEKGGLAGQPLVLFLFEKEDTTVYHDYLHKLLKTEQAQACDLRMLRRAASPSANFSGRSGPVASPRVPASSVALKPMPFYAHLDGIVIYDERETVQGFRITISDITAQKRAQLALRESEARFRLLAENARDLIYRYRLLPTPKFEYVSPAALALTGYTPEEHYADPYLGFKLVHPDDRPLLEAMSSGEVSKDPLVLRWVRKDGSVLWTEQRNVPIYDDDGQLVAIEGVARDITERKQAEMELLESEARYRRLVESSPDILYVYSSEQGGIYYSPRVEAVLGYAPDYLYDHPFLWGDSIYNGDRENVAQAVENFAEGQRIDIEYRIRDAEGNLHWLHDRSIGRRIEGDELIIEGLATDITKSKRAEEALQQAHRELAIKAEALEEANQELTQYAYVVSHDLRTPLRAIHNYVDFLHEDLEGRLNKEQQLYLDGLSKAVQDAEALVSDLLELSRLGRREGSFEPIDTGLLLQDLVAVMDLPKNVEIVMEGTYPTLNLDEVVFRQVFQNLISNAVKFNRADCKQVRIGCRVIADVERAGDIAPEAAYEFYVRDNGIGIDPRYHKQIFGVFERLHTADEYEGTGIGLAIVRKGVAKLGGTVHLESEVGQGSTFFVRLPKA
jgi:PAS domain S-box-containing protein